MAWNKEQIRKVFLARGRLRKASNSLPKKKDQIVDRAMAIKYGAKAS